MATNSTHKGGHAMTTTTTHAYVCDCGCGATIAVDFVGGFAGTTCRVEACARRRKIGALAVHTCSKGGAL
jgi:hypothetical protein